MYWHGCRSFCCRINARTVYDIWNTVWDQVTKSETSIQINGLALGSVWEGWWIRLPMSKHSTHWSRDKIDVDIFKCILLNENVGIPIKISLKFVPKSRMNNNPALVQIMAWRWPGDKPLSEPMMVCLPTHICVTWRQRVKSHTDLACKHNRSLPHCPLGPFY